MSPPLGSASTRLLGCRTRGVRPMTKHAVATSQAPLLSRGACCVRRVGCDGTPRERARRIDARGGCPVGRTPSRKPCAVASSDASRQGTHPQRHRRDTRPLPPDTTRNVCSRQPEAGARPSPTLGQPNARGLSGPRGTPILRPEHADGARSAPEACGGAESRRPSAPLQPVCWAATLSRRPRYPRFCTRRTWKIVNAGGACALKTTPPWCCCVARRWGSSMSGRTDDSLRKLPPGSRP